MAKSLVIVESPAKAKTINRYLGNDYIVKSSVGHIRDLPTSGSGAPADPKKRAAEAAKTKKMSPEKRAAYKKEKARTQLVARMGIDPDHGWDANYEILPGKEKVVKELRQAAEKADIVYLATDRDREGEAIAWHLQQAIGGDPSRYKRVVFNEITKRAIDAAFVEPGEVDVARVNAQQARRFLDRVVGYMVSPLLWSKVARGLSAGRVQSVAVRLIVEREREIRAFIPEEYWEVFANLARDEQVGELVRARFQVSKRDGKNFRPGSEDETNEALALLQAASYEVANREDRPTSTKPGAPFITSTLQQSASTRLGFSVKKTMTLAQRLYEAGHITYMRTDSTNLSVDAVEACRNLVRKDFGDLYVPDDPRLYASKEAAQEAHEAIRPSDVTRRPESIPDLDHDAQRLYEMIWRQFVACQMPNAQYTSTTITVKAGDFELKLRGRILRFDGYTRVQPPSSRGDGDTVVPDLQVGEPLRLMKLDPFQHFTKPPPRFGEASLVKEMEKLGIGRPSTYAAIIQTIQDRGYVRLENRRFFAEKIGEIVTDRLTESFTNLLDYDFTARMEETLDEVADGEKAWKLVLDEFYEDFKAKLDAAGNDEGGMRPNAPLETPIECPTCGRPMQLRTASTGVFLGCSGYSLPPKERCTKTLNLIPGDEAVDLDADEEGESKALLGRRRCSIDGASMDSWLLDEKRKLHVCGNSPDCPGLEIEEGEFRIKGYEGPTLECDKCGAEMQLKSGRFGKYFGCTAEECKNTRKLLRSGEPAPPKMDPVPMPELQCEKVEDTYVLRDGAAGLFLAASQFPRHRETRAPLVKELLAHRNEIDPKYTYIFDAPTEDPKGNPAVIRWSRKLKEQYVMSEVEGKATGWRAVYENGAWKEAEPEAVKKGGRKKKAPAKKKAAG